MSPATPFPHRVEFSKRRQRRGKARLRAQLQWWRCPVPIGATAMARILDTINSPADVKRLPLLELEQLASEIREELITVFSRTGGHLGPNLGVVELTIAMHYVFNTPEDHFLFDVSHQAYVHKLLTGAASSSIPSAHPADSTDSCCAPKVPHDCLRRGTCGYCALSRSRDGRGP